MNSAVLLILIINGSASVYETRNMKECQEVREYIMPRLVQAFKPGTFAAECFHKMGGHNKQA